MYSPPTSAKRQLIKQIAIYALMTLSVSVMVLLLILVMLGYRVDSEAGTIQQGGLVQFGSIPSGASLTINAARLSATTSTKATLAPGPHAIQMAREGYLPWQKTVDVRSGTILWLNYARLIPNERPVENILELPAITSSMQSPSKKWYAMTAEASAPAIRLVDVSNDTPDSKTLTLPEGSYTKPENTENEKYVLRAWDPSSRYLLVEHSYDGKVEWIVADVEDSSRTKNITTTFDIEMTKPQFSQTDTQVLYAIINGDVRRIDIPGATISAPLVRNVAEFSFYERSTLMYVTAIDQTTKTRTVGYRQENASEPRTIRSYSDEGTVPLHITASKYYSQTYVGIAYGSSVEILSGSLPRSDSRDPLSLTAVATMSTAGPIGFFSNKTGGRFFVAQHANSFSVYDLELQKATTTAIRTDTPVTTELRWLDGYIVWSGYDSTLRFYEFDGANQNDIMPIVTGQNPALTANNRFIYAPTLDDNGVFRLSRIRMLL